MKLRSPSKRSNIPVRIHRTAYLAVLCILVILLWRYRHELSQLLGQAWTPLIAATILSAMTLVIQAVNFVQFLPQSAQTYIRSSICFWPLANLANYLAPFQPGLGLRLAYFKSLGISLGSSGRATMQQLLASSWLALWLLGLGVFLDLYWLKWTGWIALSAVVGTYLALVALRKWLPLWKLPAGFSIDWREIRYSRLQLSMVSLQYFLGALNIYAVYQLNGVDFPPTESLMLAAALGLSTLLAITPNNVGIMEFIMGYIAHAHGVSPAQALFIAMTFRVGHLASCGILLLLCLTGKLSRRERPRK